MGVPANFTTSCPDWQERIKRGDSLIACPPMFPESAAEAIEVFGNLRMVDVAGSPLLRDISRPWITDFVGQIFGAYEEETGIRHIQDFYLLISKKNGKSSIAAGIMVTALLLNWRQSAEFLIISPTVEIANNSFKPAADMVRADEELMELLEISEHTRTIKHRVTGATLKVVAADSDTVGGKKAVGVLVDEHWLFGKRPHAESMFREALGGLASRPEGFVIYLTTQSDEPPAGVFRQKLEYARKVRDGVIEDNRFLPVLYEFPREMILTKEYELPENFHITNPNIIDPLHPNRGGSVSHDFIRRELAMAYESGESSVIGMVAKHLNVEIGIALGNDAWAGAEYWADTSKPGVNLSYLIEHCEVICVGIDGGGLDDLLGAAFVGRAKEFEDVVIPAHFDPEKGEHVPEQLRSVKKWYSYHYAWAHPSVLKRRKKIVSKLQDIAKAGEMTLVSYVGQDVVQLAQMVKRVDDAGLLDKVGLDPAAVGAILDALLQDGIDEEKIVGVSQGWRLAGAIKTTERKLAERVLWHNGSLLMNWCVGNAKTKMSGNALVIQKALSGAAKIDPLMALFNAVHLMALNPPAMVGELDMDYMVMLG